MYPVKYNMVNELFHDVKFERYVVITVPNVNFVILNLNIYLIKFFRNLCLWGAVFACHIQIFMKTCIATFLY